MTKLRELSDFIDLPEKEQQKIMMKVIENACRMQRETIQLAEQKEDAEKIKKSLKKKWKFKKVKSW